MLVLKLCLLSLILLLGSCANRVQKAIRDVKYSAWEKVGVEKRDIFKREVANVKENQEDSGEAFKDALTKLKEVYAFDGGNVEREYNKLNSSYQNANEDAEAVSASISKLNTVAEDLFTEWQGELNALDSADLKRRSRDQLRQTRSKYENLYSHLKISEKKMAPVLARLKDQTVFLKHNLNAQAISGLKAEGDKIEGDIEKLITEMNKSNKEAEAFIKSI